MAIFLKNTFALSRNLNKTKKQLQRCPNPQFSDANSDSLYFKLCGPVNPAYIFSFNYCSGQIIVSFFFRVNFLSSMNKQRKEQQTQIDSDPQSSSSKSDALPVGI